MATVKAEFDGRVFVRSEEVQLPVGTPVEVLLPATVPTPTAEESQEWQEILREFQATKPKIATVEEALGYSRKRP